MRAARVLAAASVILLAAAPAGAQTKHLRPNDLAARATPAPTSREAYGSDPLQFGELRMPAGKGPFPLVVIVHGGCWTKGFATLKYMDPLAADLAAKGVATWNIEYRQLGDAGAGWPGSFLDWANGADHVRALARRYPLDLKRVVVIGHSAGAHAALWLAGRARVAAMSPIRGSRDPLPFTAAVAIDGPGDITSFMPKEQDICGAPVIESFMGGGTKDAPGHYADGNPSALLPIPARQALVSSAVLTPDEAAAYAARAKAKGQTVERLDLTGAAHFDMLDPASPSGRQLEALILEQTRR